MLYLLAEAIMTHSDAEELGSVFDKIFLALIILVVAIILLVVGFTKFFSGGSDQKKISRIEKSRKM